MLNYASWKEPGVARKSHYSRNMYATRLPRSESVSKPETPNTHNEPLTSTTTSKPKTENSEDWSRKRERE
jgi:hypothetical protein